MKNNVFAKRIPTVLGLLILIGGLVAGIILVGQKQGFGLKAGPTATPKDVKIANRGSTGFTVSWDSDVPVTGYLKYSDNPTSLTLPAGDQRDQIAGSTNQYTTHYVDVTGLSPDKTYYFEIGSGSQTYNDNGKPYQIRTAPTAAAPAEDVISGKIVTGAGTGSSGAIVYVEINGAETLSALTKTDGTWRLALSNARNKNGDYVAYDKAKETITIFVQAGTAGTATAITNTANANPVPEVTLGKTHNFATGEVAPVISDLTSGKSGGAGFASISNLSQAPEATFSVKLINPSAEGDRLATQLPEFLGTGPEGTLISLVLDKIGQSGVATPSATNNWSWSPAIKLSLGQHTIAVAYKDDKGANQSFSRGFTILAAGSIGGLPAFSSTPSATPTEVATSSPAPTKKVSMPATSSGMPKSGVLTPAYILLILGIGLFISGIVWRRRLLSEIND